MGSKYALPSEWAAHCEAPEGWCCSCWRNMPSKKLNWADISPAMNINAKDREDNMAVVKLKAQDANETQWQVTRYLYHVLKLLTSKNKLAPFSSEWSLDFKQHLRDFDCFHSARPRHLSLRPLALNSCCNSFRTPSVDSCLPSRHAVHRDSIQLRHLQGYNF